MSGAKPSTAAAVVLMAYAVVFHPSLPASPAGGFENTGQIPEKIGRRIASYFLRYSLCLALYKKIPGKIPGKKKVPTRLWNGSETGAGEVGDGAQYITTTAEEILQKESRGEQRESGRTPTAEERAGSWESFDCRMIEEEGKRNLTELKSPPTSTDPSPRPHPHAP